jgi:hypothetical protein
MNIRRKCLNIIVTLISLFGLVDSQAANFKGIMFNEELSEISLIELKIKKGSRAVIKEQELLKFGRSDNELYKSTYDLESNGNNCFQVVTEKSMVFSITFKTDKEIDGIDVDGVVLISGKLRYKFYLYNEDIKPIMLQRFTDKTIWVGDKIGNTLQGFGIFICYQKSYTQYDEKFNSPYSNERERYKDYQYGKPVVFIGQFDKGNVAKGLCHINYDFDDSSSDITGYKKIVAPVVKGNFAGAGILTNWNYDQEEANSYAYVGNLKGLFFDDGIVKGFNFKNELTDDCICKNNILQCKRLKQRYAEKQFAEFLGVASIAVAETGVLLSLANKMIGGGSAVLDPANEKHINVDNRKVIIQKKSTLETLSCYGEKEEAGNGYYRCNAKIKDIRYRIKCSNGKYKTYFYNPVFNSGCLVPDQIGYIGLDDLTKTTLGTDYDKAMKKLCGCE